MIRVRLIHLGFCADHKNNSQLDHFLSPEGYVKIAKFVRERGKKAPTAKTARLAWQPIGPADLAILEEHTDYAGVNTELAF